MRIITAIFLALFAVQHPALLAEEQQQEREYAAQVLKQARIPTDSQSLLQFLQSRSPDFRRTLQIEKDIRLLADESFHTRFKACKRLIKHGTSALPKLKAALKSDDAEVRRLARECIQTIEAHDEASIISAVLLLLKKHQPKGAVAILLRYLPNASEEVRVEVIETLMVLGIEKGKVDNAIINDLQHSHEIRRSVAAYIVGRYGDRKQQEGAKKLLSDNHSLVRLRTAQGLLVRGDKQMISVLIELLAKAPLAIAEEAEFTLSHIAGENAPKITLESNQKDRQSCQAAWREWHQQYGMQLELKKVEYAPVYLTAKIRAQKVVKQFWQSVFDGKQQQFERLSAVPFYAIQYTVANSRTELNQLYQFVHLHLKQAENRPKIETKHLLPRQTFMKAGRSKAIDFLKRYPPSQIQIVLIKVTHPGNSTFNGAMFVRREGVKLRVVGLAELSNWQPGK